VSGSGQGGQLGTAETADDSAGVPRGGVSWVYASTLSVTLGGALFYLYLARVLPLGELGAVVILQAFAFILATGAALGLGRGFQHFLSYHRARGELPVVRTLLGMSYVTTALLSLVAVGVAVSLSGELGFLLFHSRQYTPAVELLSVFSGLLTAEMILAGVLLGIQRYTAYSVVVVLGSVTMYGFPILLFALSPNVQSIVLGWILGGVVQTSASVVMIQRLTLPLRSSRDRSPTPLGARYRSLFTYSAPVLASLLITTGTYYIDRLILASLVNLPTVGVYNYAILFASASLFVVSPFAAILVSRISALFGRGESATIRALVRTSNTLVVLVFVPLALALAALGPFLLRYIVGAAFVGASLPMAVLLVISALFVPFTILVSLATGTRRTSVIMVSSSSALLGNAVLSVALVPHIGMLGAALGNSAMFWAPFIVLYISLRSTGLVEYDVRSISRIWAAASAGAVSVGVPLVLLHYSPILVPVFFALGAGVFLASLRLLRALPSEVTEALNHHLPRWASAARPLICWAGACDRPHDVEGREGPVSPLSVERR